MATFSKILGLATTALAFAGVAFGQATCSTAVGLQTPLIRIEGTTELVGEYQLACGSATYGGGTVQILATASLPVTSKALATSGTIYTEAAAVVSVGGVVQATVLGTVSGSTVTFGSSSAPVTLPAGASTVNIVNIRVNATTLTQLQPVTESTFVIGLTNANSGSPASSSQNVAFGFPGLASQTVYGAYTAPTGTSGLSLTSKGSPNAILVCQGYNSSSSNTNILSSVIDVGENFAQAFKGQGSTTTNTVLGSEFISNVETGYNVSYSGTTNLANAGTIIQVVFNNVAPQVTSIYVPITVVSDQSLASTPIPSTGSLWLVASPSNLTVPSAASGSSVPQLPSGTGKNAFALTPASGTATAYYLFVPGTASTGVQESFAIEDYIVQTANSSTATTGAMTASVSFAPIGSTPVIPSFVVGASTSTLTLSAFTGCTTSLLFPFVTNQLGFDTGLAIANTSSDPFLKNGATPQAGTCTISFYGAGAPSPSNVVTPSVPSGTVYTAVLSGIGAGFQGYLIAQCNFQYAHGFAFVTDGVGANGGLSQGYLAGVIPDTNQVARTTANPIGSVTVKGNGETLGN
jgi:hypothetical protein